MNIITKKEKKNTEKEPYERGDERERHVDLTLMKEEKNTNKKEEQ